MKLLLTAISGSRQGKTFTVEANSCVSFGRTDASTWSFEDDGHMSGVHFEVENLGEHCEVRDRGSTNGTWLNNEKIEGSRLREGDRIRAGVTVLTVEFVQTVVPGSTERNFEAPNDHEIPDRPAIAAEPRPPLAIPPAPEPLPNTDRLAAPKPINPFDSIDFASEGAIPADLLGTPPEKPPIEQHSPISDSSYSLSPPAQQEPIAAPHVQEVHNQEIYKHRFLHRQVTQDAADSLSIVLDSLASKWSIHLVLHFQKVRTIPPLPPQVMQPIFSWLADTEAASYSPIRIAWNDVVTGDAVLPLLPRLCRADGCLAFLSESATEIGPQIDQMLELGVEGFSEQNGFLPTCWPSGLTAIIDSVGLGICETLFAGKIAGAMMCSAQDRTMISAIADSQLADALRDVQFS